MNKIIPAFLPGKRTPLKKKMENKSILFFWLVEIVLHSVTILITKMACAVILVARTEKYASLREKLINQDSRMRLNKFYKRNGKNSKVCDVSILKVQEPESRKYICT